MYCAGETPGAGGARTRAFLFTHTRRGVVGMGQGTEAVSKQIIVILACGKQL